jgi:hypothetical protein
VEAHQEIVRRFPLSAIRNPQSIARFIFAPDTSSASRFVVRADEKLTAFLELESVIRAVSL